MDIKYSACNRNSQVVVKVFLIAQEDVTNVTTEYATVSTYKQSLRYKRDSRICYCQYPYNADHLASGSRNVLLLVKNIGYWFGRDVQKNMRIKTKEFKK